jgi:HTH-type transcriptional regulator / antitoxin HipB
MILSELVLQTRKQANLTQAELAELAGVGRTVIWDLEHGKRSVRLETLVKILAPLNIELMARSPVTKEEIRL